MLSVILIWLYMLFTCYVTGVASIRIMAGKDYSCKQEISYVYAGIGVVMVYAQLFSLFGGVGFTANLILLFACAICLVFLKKDFLNHLHTCRLTITPIKAMVFILILSVFAYGTSTGVIHYDTGLYHAQSIRWIEEYGVVPGLGNLHSRLAYNSAAFCLSALYSMAFLGGQSYHCCAGFLAFLLMLVCLEGLTKEKIRKGRALRGGLSFRKPWLSDFARITAVYYLLIIFDEMVSPASDYFMVLLVFFILIRWLDLTEEKENSCLPYGLLCVLGVSVVTVKLSGALILLLTVKPAVMMIKEKQGKEIAKFLLTGLLTVLPFLIRNVILSGWLVYPFTSLDLFSFAFKIPKGMAEYDAREIQVWGRGLTDVERYGEPPSRWLPEWAAGLDGSNKAFLVMALLGILLWAAYLLYAAVKKRKDMLDFLHMAGTLLVCFLFWLLSAPLVRYGCVFLWMFPVMVWGYLYLQISPHMDRFKIYLIGLALFGVYKLAAFGIETGKGATAQYLIRQKDYENFETVSYELHGYTFYYPLQGDRVGYRDFPSAPVKAEDIFLGDTIREGFKDVIHE